MTTHRPVSASFLRELLAVAARAQADGDEWDTDDIPEASLELAAMCNPANVARMVEEILAARGHEAELKRLADDRDRWRARAPVTDEDCKRAGITWAHVDAFMREVYPSWVGYRHLAMGDMISRGWGDMCPQDNLDRCAAALDGEPGGGS